jgi:hypothetical protein
MTDHRSSNLLNANAKFVAVSAVAGVVIGVFLAFRMLSAGAHPVDPDEVMEPGCSGLGVASFAGVDSLEALAKQSDAAVLGRITGRTKAETVYGEPGSDAYDLETFVIHEVSVTEVLYGQITKSTIRLGHDYDFCLASGADYVLFLKRVRAEDESYIDRTDVHDNPGEFTFQPAGVFMIDENTVIGTSRLLKKQGRFAFRGGDG